MTYRMAFPMFESWTRTERWLTEVSHLCGTGVPNGIARALALPRQPLTLPEVGGCAASAVKARCPARRAAEPDGPTVSIGAQLERPALAGPSGCGVPWWTFFELQVCIDLLMHTHKSAQRRERRRRRGVILSHGLAQKPVSGYS